MSAANAKQITRLLGFWPQANVADNVMGAYGEAVAGANPEDVRRAVDDFLFRRVERNHAFIPVPGELSNRIILHRNERLDEEARNKPRLRPPAPNDSPEEIARRKAFVDRIVRPAINDMRRASAGPSQEEHDAKVRATIAEAMSIDGDKLDAMIAALPDQKPKVAA